MNEHMEKQVSISEMARSAGKTRRQVERIFAVRVGTIPFAHFMRFRLSSADELVRYTDVSVTEIAFAASFQLATYFSRLYRAEFSIQPTSSRMASRDERNHLCSDARPWGDPILAIDIFMPRCKS